VAAAVVWGEGGGWGPEVRRWQCRRYATPVGGGSKSVSVGERERKGNATAGHT